MRSCLWRCRHLSQGVQWSLLLAVLVFFLFALPSFIKEPQTKPSRMVSRAPGHLMRHQGMGVGR
ncbi:ST6GALNAC1 isoform 11 [Pan troglodytes]|uniref:ST6GALNAC1 isoform 1 n=3 Tax=Pan TaxID=9596 RepID=A0A6D2XDJ8_PANTR|nr:ST6GALNAC1 isoform 1 [Pan troglodytes]PNI30946.1 ST6GALNAC1 isoform 11 [Pan troglodytes]